MYKQTTPEGFKMTQSIKILTEAHSYPSIENAEKAWAKIVSDHAKNLGLPEIRYIISAQEDGRFTIVVISTTDTFQKLMALNEMTNWKFGLV